MRLSPLSLLLSLLSPLSLLLSLPSPAASGTPGRVPVSQLVTDFGLRLSRVALEARGDTNAVLAPLGVTSLLVALQVATAGDSRRQLEAATGLSIDGAGVPAQLRGLLRALRAPGRGLRAAQALFVSPGLALRPRFVPRLLRALGAPSLGSLGPGFGEGARGALNAWARERTAGQVSALVPPGALSPRARLVLASALAFRGLWGVPFPAGATRARPFLRPDGREVPVPVMAREGHFRCGDFATPSGVPFTVAEVPYAGGEVALLLVAPAERGVPIVTLARLLDGDSVTRWVTELSPARRLLLLPRLSLETSWDLRGPLRALGVRAPFDPAAADFSPMSGEPHLALGAVLQKVRLEVAENGTEAASASAAVVHSRMAPLEIAMDRPFLFLIRHRPSGTVLFVGQVTEP